ncbi:type II secretion system F family protein [Photobacterium rosenbergii]|uniref:Type II secretion system F family protein n=1 Tax=Photobacterium rosenbergii TaxID=294936 RepID=A0ABU3ZFG2_9GAMM|nr:type II secretion system F family protein [Photobacterium rosenbergii]MDV5168684.1 type II secretion system F family protein [Photobacterium rosenbergii]
MLRQIPDVIIWCSLGMAMLALVLFVVAARQQRARKVERNLANRLGKGHRREQVLQQGQLWWSRTKRYDHSFIVDVIGMLRRAGYISNREQLQCLLKLLMLWLGIQAAMIGLLVEGVASQHPVGFMVIAAAGGAYVLILWLRRRAAARTRLIDEEIIVGLQMMKSLWEVGLSLESLLRVYTQELALITPEINKEFRLVLSKIEAGQDRNMVFTEGAKATDSPGLQDVLTMFAQASVSGGSMSNTFNQLTLLLRDRRRTQLQEKVTKLSGQMSVVMIVFLFPALLVVMAGPGMMLLGQALG